MSANRPGRSLFIQELLELYLRIPETPARPSPRDRQVAASLHQAGVGLELARAALLTGLGRRKSGGCATRIRSLAYFIPIIDELEANLDPANAATYEKHLERRLGHFLGPPQPPVPTRNRPARKTPGPHVQLLLPFGESLR